MPMDVNGQKPYQLRISEDARETEIYGPVFGSGTMEEISRKFVNELRDAAASPEVSQSQSKNALEKLNRFAEQGSKFAAQALEELGLGVRGTMDEKTFHAAIEKMGLDPTTKRKLTALGPKFLQYASNLVEDSSTSRFELNDLANRLGGEAAIGLVSEFNAAERETIAVQFVKNNPDYEVNDANSARLVGYLGFKYLHVDIDEYEDIEDAIEDLLVRGHWTVQNLTEAFHILRNEGLLLAKEGTARPLSKNEKQSLSLAAASIRWGTANQLGDFDRVLDGYLQFALGDSAPRHWSDVIGNQNYYDVLFDAVFFIWSQTRADYTPSEGAEQYLRRYLAGRFPTVPLLNAGWEKAKQETGGRGLIAPEQQMVDEEQAYEDSTLTDINNRFTVRR